MGRGSQTLVSSPCGCWQGPTWEEGGVLSPYVEPERLQPALTELLAKKWRSEQPTPMAVTLSL